jgi:hypothetical protein
VKGATGRGGGEGGRTSGGLLACLLATPQPLCSSAPSPKGAHAPQMIAELKSRHTHELAALRSEHAKAIGRERQERWEQGSRLRSELKGKDMEIHNLRNLGASSAAAPLAASTYMEAVEAHSGQRAAHGAPRAPCARVDEQTLYQAAAEAAAESSWHGAADAPAQALPLPPAPPLGKGTAAREGAGAGAGEAAPAAPAAAVEGALG